MYVFMYVCMHVWIDACMHAHVYVCLYVCKCVCMYVHMFVCMHVRTQHTRTHTHGALIPHHSWMSAIASARLV